MKTKFILLSVVIGAQSFAADKMGTDTKIDPGQVRTAPDATRLRIQQGNQETQRLKDANRAVGQGAVGGTATGAIRGGGSGNAGPKASGNLGKQRLQGDETNTQRLGDVMVKTAAPEFKVEASAPAPKLTTDEQKLAEQSNQATVAFLTGENTRIPSAATRVEALAKTFDASNKPVADAIRTLSKDATNLDKLQAAINKNDIDAIRSILNGKDFKFDISKKMSAEEVLGLAKGAVAGLERTLKKNARYMVDNYGMKWEDALKAVAGKADLSEILPKGYTRQELTEEGVSKDAAELLKDISKQAEIARAKTGADQNAVNQAEKSLRDAVIGIYRNGGSMTPVQISALKGYAVQFLGGREGAAKVAAENAAAHSDATKATGGRAQVASTGSNATTDAFKAFLIGRVAASQDAEKVNTLMSQLAGSEYPDEVVASWAKFVTEAMKQKTMGDRYRSFEDQILAHNKNMTREKVRELLNQMDAMGCPIGRASMLNG